MMTSPFDDELRLHLELNEDEKKAWPITDIATNPPTSNIVDITTKEYTFTLDELKAIYQRYSNEFVSYEDDELIAVMKKIASIVESENK